MVDARVRICWRTPLIELSDVQHQLTQRWDRLASALNSVDETLLGIDRAREETDAVLTDLPQVREMLDRRLAQPDVEAPPLREEAGWMPVEVTLDEGLRFEVMLDTTISDPVSAGLATGRPSDQNLLSLMLQIVGPGDHILDLGAHVGIFALTASAAGCGVIAVEASPDNAALLRLSSARNGFHDLRIVNAVVGDTAGHVVFEAKGPWGHRVWDGDDPATEGATTLTVASVAVDDILDAFVFSNIKFVKMDVEGSELLAIEGMRRLLSHRDAPPILFESNGHALAFASATPNDLFRRLEEFGYVCYQVNANRLTRLDSSAVQLETVIECLAVKRRPAGLGGWEIRPAMTGEDVLLRIAAESRHPNPDCRIYIGRTLARLDEDLLTHPIVAAALDDLRNDAVPEVREAAGWPAASEPAGQSERAGQMS